MMDISFKNRKLAKLFNEGAQLEKTHGSIRAKKIRLRMAAFRAANSLQDFWPPKTPPERCHELPEGKRKGRLSVDLDVDGSFHLCDAAGDGTADGAESV